MEPDEVENTGSNGREMTIEEVCDHGRKAIQEVGELIFAVNKRHSFFFNREQEYSDQYGEMHANFMLAYRHLEDARMRLGKVLQAMTGGKSIFDK
jgi:hypothetical protein